MIEIWKDVKGYEGLYKVSNTGKIYSFNSKKILSLKSLNTRGYNVVCLYKNGKAERFCVHKLVAATFIENPNNYSVVDHLDGNKTNNNVTNLEWVTQKENVHRAIRMRQARKETP